MSKKTLLAILLAILFSISLPATVQAQIQGNKICEQCGMIVSPDAQVRYIVSDQTSAIHYVECFMCALNLVNAYSEVHIVTSCDWYGPNYVIMVDSKNFGKEVTVNPPTAMFLNGGSCVINRAAYNQTAADALLANGYSDYTLIDQHYTLPSGTKVVSVINAALEYGQISSGGQTAQTGTVLIAVAAIGGIIIVVSVLAFRRLRSPQEPKKE